MRTHSIRAVGVAVAICAVACAGRVDSPALADAGPESSVPSDAPPAADPCAIWAGEETTLATAQHGPSYLAVDDTHVYWAQSQLPGNELMRVAKVGGTPEIVGTGATGTYGMVVDDGWLYWCLYGVGYERDPVISRVPKGGGTGEVLSSAGSRSTDLVADEATLYYLSTGSLGASYSDGSVIAVAKDGRGGASTLATAQSWIGSLRIVGSQLFWLRTSAPSLNGAAPMEVVTMPTSGGGVTKVAGASSRILNLATDGARLYWLEGDYMIADLVSADLEGNDRRVVAPGLSGHGLLVDDRCVYVGGGGALSRVGKHGGKVATIATTGTPRALDATHVYGSNYGATGTIVAWAK